MTMPNPDHYLPDPAAVDEVVPSDAEVRAYLRDWITDNPDATYVDTEDEAIEYICEEHYARKGHDPRDYDAMTERAREIATETYATFNPDED